MSVYVKVIFWWRYTIWRPFLFFCDLLNDDSQKSSSGHAQSGVWAAWKDPPLLTKLVFANFSVAHVHTSASVYTKFPNVCIAVGADVTQTWKYQLSRDIPFHHNDNAAPILLESLSNRATSFDNQVDQVWHDAPNAATSKDQPTHRHCESRA